MSIFSNNATIDFLLENATTYAEKRDIYALKESAEDVKNAGNNLVSKLYKSAINKSYVDFDNIPASAGDITKYSGYDEMVRTLSIIDTIAAKSNINIPEIAVINKAISNVIGLRDVFTKGFSLNKDFLILQYNTIVAACVEATTGLIYSFTEFTKSVQGYEIHIVNTKNNQAGLSYKNLETFNKSVGSGEYSKIAHIVLKTDAAKGLITESAVIITAAVISSMVVLVVMMRDIVFRLFYAKMKLSEYLKLQSAFLAMNKSVVEANSAGLSIDKKNKIIKKQAKLAGELSKLSDKLKVEDSMSNQRASAEIKKDNYSFTLDKVKSDDRVDNFQLL